MKKAGRFGGLPPECEVRNEERPARMRAGAQWCRDGARRGRGGRLCRAFHKDGSLYG